MFQHRPAARPSLILMIVGLLLAACSNPQPTPTVPLKSFTQHLGVFSLQVPQTWQSSESDTPTEALATFSEPNKQAELLAYTGLLDRRLTETERQQTLSALIGVLLNSPADLRLTDQQQQADGTYTANLSFTRGGEKRSGVARFRTDPLVLSGVVLTGPEANWTNTQSTLQPVLDSFKVHADYVQGTYFKPLEGDRYALAIPADWEALSGSNSKKIRSRNGMMQIAIVEAAQDKTLNASELTEQGVKLGQRSFGHGTLTGSQQLPDGRIKLSIQQETDSTVGYLDQKDGAIIGLFFEVPTERLADYQPIIDFMYSTYITGK